MTTRTPRPPRTRHRHRTPVVAVAACLAMAACTPYSVGQTARTVPEGRTQSAATFVLLPGFAAYDSTKVRTPGLESEIRKGIDAHSDWGLRLNSLSGLIGTYKRELEGGGSLDEGVLSFMVGGGLVNLGQHAHLEFTVFASAAETRTAVPYGGLRTIQVIPLNRGAVHDTPVLGGFGGIRFGGAADGISLELGVFRDRSALQLRKGTVVWVPSVTLGNEFVSRIPGVGRGPRR